MNREVCEHFNSMDLPCDKCKAAPIAWYHVPYPNNGVAPMVSLSQQHEPSMYGAAVPLYLAPPQRPAEATTIAEWWADRKRKPLTKEKIRELLDIETEALPSYRSAVEELPERLARAVERAHGIGVDK